ncbi:MAG: sensor histidine kinase [Eubacteriales bacterium]|nr:sensor histidine kinase [Eubacteriales bacterium]
MAGREKQSRLESKMRNMLLGAIIPMTLLMVVFLAIFLSYTKKYNQLSQNLAVSSSFGLEFKDTVDLECYYVAIGSEDKDKLPVGQVDGAIATVEKLKATTYQRESGKCIKHLNAYLSNLKKYMLELMEIEGYDERMVFMDNNIRSITSSITKELQTYIYLESTNLVSAESVLARSSMVMVLCMSVIIVLTILILMRRTLRFSDSITRPVTEILHNVKKVGRGNFDIRPVESDVLEIGELDEGTRKMAGRIQGLLDNVRKEQEAQHLTELQLLQAQVNPHFLYNTLDTIVWLIEGGQDEDALEMISNLSIFFRTSLSKGNDIITLEEEERHTLSYLEIQQSRYRDILEFEISIPESLKQVLVPKLTLQPLAENALYHGIKNKRGGGKILIEGFDLGNDLMLRVSDNGQGMTSQRLSQVQQSIQTGERTGFGTAAVAERIRLYYGPGYGLRISSTEGEGTVMEVYLAKKIRD